MDLCCKSEMSQHHTPTLHREDQLNTGAISDMVHYPSCLH